MRLSFAAIRRRHAIFDADAFSPRLPLRLMLRRRFRRHATPMLLPCRRPC